jgi:RNA polymerase sigma-70 factor (ECF subfamily)
VGSGKELRPLRGGSGVSSHSPDEATTLLARLSAGDPAAAGELLEILYAELRRLASAALARERPGHTLQTTALVHDAFMKLISQKKSDWQNRAHFIAVASTALRQILVDHARRRIAEKRGGEGRIRVALHEGIEAAEGPHDDLLDVNDALQRLAAEDARTARVFELRTFGGLEMEEIAHVLGVSKRTVEGDWSYARAWIRRELTKGLEP